MRRKLFVVGAAAICVFAVVIVLRVHFFSTRNWGSLATKSVRVNTPSLAAPRPATVIGARTPVVPLAFDSPSRPASATGQGKTTPRPTQRMIDLSGGQNYISPLQPQAIRQRYWRKERNWRLLVGKHWLH